MMRITLGALCALALSLALGACTASSGTSKSVDAAGPHCGDGVCASSEVNTCPQDCGQGGGNNGGGNQAVCGNGTCDNGETVTSCPTDCGGTGSGSGSGSSGTLNCSDQNTVLACAACLALNTCAPPYDAASCQGCLGGGLGSGSGLGSGCPTGCNCDGVCDPGETSAQCPLDGCP